MKTNHILILVAILSLCSGCKNSQKNTNAANIAFVAAATQAEAFSQEATIKVDLQQVRVFYRFFKDEVLTYQRFSIVNNKIVLDYLDMDFYGYHISHIDHQGDSVIRMTFDKEINLLDYDDGKLVLFDSYLPNAPRNMNMLKNTRSHVWEIYINDDTTPYKFLVIDSLDLKKAGYKVDTVNYWLYDVE